MSNRGRHKKITKHTKTWITNVLAKDVILKIIQNQVDQGNPADIHIFEIDPWASKYNGGFSFSDTPEGSSYWRYVASVIQNYKDNQL